MKRAKIYILFSLFFIYVNAQNIDKIGEIGQFLSASSFSINNAGYIFVADNAKNEIYKMDTLGANLKYVGGYGWGESNFDNPSDVFATTLNLYVTDKNNNRIQIFDKDLNYLSQFKTDKSQNKDFQFAYPKCAAVSNQGDLYILDSDNSRILKYGLSGNFLQDIGGNSAGDYSLSEPLDFAISDDGKIYIVDAIWIYAFDQYGTGLFKFEPGIDALNISITNNKLLLNNTDQIKIIELNEIATSIIDISSSQLQIDGTIKETFLFGNKLYILTDTSIHIFRIKN